MTDETERNPLRALMVDTIIKRNYREPLTVEALSGFFPSDFFLGFDDLQPHIDAATKASALSELEFEGEAPQAEPTPQEPAEELQPQAKAVAAIEAEPEAVEIVPPTPEEIETAVLRRIQADQDLANRRSELLSAQSAERVARDALAKAVTQFQIGLNPLSPQELRNQYVREQQAIRQAIADGTMEAPRRGAGVGKSAIDRVAYWQKFGGGPAAGGGRAYARGAAPSQARGAPNYNPKLGTVAKVPSEV